MVQNDMLNTVDLVKNRLFQGGRVLPLWQMFRVGQLDGWFVLTGQDWSATIDLAGGQGKGLVVRDRYKKATGLEGFAELQRFVMHDCASRFSIIVPEKVEHV
jgi:hypothetical protein